MRTIEEQLVDFMLEFCKCWRMLNGTDKEKCYDMTISTLIEASFYDVEMLREYFDGNYMDLIDIAEGRL